MTKIDAQIESTMMALLFDAQELPLMLNGLL